MKGHVQRDEVKAWNVVVEINQRRRISDDPAKHKVVSSNVTNVAAVGVLFFDSKRLSKLVRDRALSAANVEQVLRGGKKEEVS